MSELDAAKRPSQAKLTEFYPLYVDALQCDEILDFDLYLQTQPGRPPILYRERHLVMTQEALGRLRDAKVRQVHVPQSQRKALQAYLAKNLRAVLRDPKVPIDEKSSLLYFSAQETIREILENPLVGDTISQSRAMVGNAVDFLFGEERAFASLLRITSYDYYTYTHSVNVMVYAVTLARRVGLGDDAVYMRFGEATLLHDIGKSRVSAETLNCPGKLSKKQWDEIRRHPAYGKEILEELGVTDAMILDVVLHHHEKLTGTGYPEKLRGDEISLPVRVTTVVDIFDALTTRRVYKDAVSTFGALRLMKEEMAAELDPAVFRAFVELLGAAN